MINIIASAPPIDNFVKQNQQTLDLGENYFNYVQGNLKNNIRNILAMVPSSSEERNYYLSENESNELKYYMLNTCSILPPGD